MNNTLRKLGLLAVALFISNVILSQTAVCDSTNWAKPGTYEVLTIPGSTESAQTSKLPLTNDMLCLIESMRDQNNIVSYQFNYCTLIKIFPKKYKLIVETSTK
jgi:hypothetical protein